MTPEERMRPPQRPDLTLLRIRAEEAKDLLDPTGVFARAVLDLRQQWYGELMALPNDRERRDELVYKLKALESIPTQIKTYITDFKVEAGKQNRGG